MDVSAERLRDRLREAGRAAEIEPIRVRPHWAGTQAVAMVVAIAGSVVSVDSPGIGFLLVLAAAACSIVEATGATNVLLRLAGAHDAQNVWSPARGEGRGLLVLVAPLDGRRDALFHRLARRIGDPWLVLDGALLLILLCCLLRAFGFEGNGLTGLQFLLTLVPLAAVPLLVDVELSEPRPAEAEAAAAEAVVALTQELESDLRYLDVAVLLTGAHVAFGQGMRAWIRRHRKELDVDRTVVIAIPALGSGGVRWSRREGTRLLSWRTTGDVARLCAEIAGDDEDGSAFDAAPTRRRHAGDAVAALSRGIPGIAVSTAEDEPVDPQAAERARAFIAELARRIDGELAPRLHEEPIRQE